MSDEGGEFKAHWVDSETVQVGRLKVENTQKLHNTCRAIKQFRMTMKSYLSLHLCSTAL